MQDNYSKDFWKLYKPFFDAMAGLGRAENEVFIYILENFDWASNTLDAPQQVIAKNSGTSKASVERTIRTLKEKDFRRKLARRQICKAKILHRKYHR